MHTETANINRSSSQKPLMRCLWKQTLNLLSDPPQLSQKEHMQEGRGLRTSGRSFIYGWTVALTGITQRVKNTQVHACAPLTKQTVKHKDEDRPMTPDVNTHLHCDLSEMSEHFCSTTKYSRECLCLWVSNAAGSLLFTLFLRFRCL